MNKEVLKVFFKPLTWFNKAIKKDEKLIFFYTNLGFRDNVKAFYDYLIRKNYNDDYRIVVSSNERFSQRHDNRIHKEISLPPALLLMLHLWETSRALSIF